MLSRIPSKTDGPRVWTSFMAPSSANCPSCAVQGRLYGNVSLAPSEVNGISAFVSFLERNSPNITGQARTSFLPFISSQPPEGAFVLPNNHFSQPRAVSYYVGDIHRWSRFLEAL